MDNQLILFIGIPASGKSTFYCSHFFPSHVYISLDQLRSRSAEAELLAFALRRQRNCVVDNTNVTRAMRAQYIRLAKAAGWQVVGYCFVTDKASALARNALRTGRARVPDKAIGAMAAQLEYPTRDEGFDELYVVRLREDGYDVEVADEK